MVPENKQQQHCTVDKVVFHLETQFKAMRTEQTGNQS